MSERSSSSNKSFAETVSLDPKDDAVARTTAQREKRYRPSSREYWIRYGQLVERDGEKCGICGKAPPLVKLEIDHVDGHVSTWNLDTQRLLCITDNRRLQKHPTSTTTGKRGREPDWQAIAPETESEVRRSKLPQFKRAILLRLITDKRELPWVEAQFTISQQVGVASNTADRWIRELSQPYNLKGPFVSSWKNPTKGPRYKVLDLSENYSMEGPE